MINNNAVDELEDLVRPFVEQDDSYSNARELVKLLLKHHKLVKIAIDIDKYNWEN